MLVVYIAITFYYPCNRFAKVMIFHTKCGILLVLCTLKYTMKQCAAEDTSVFFQNEASDEEDAIKEALLLVELLKSAQDKPILREIDTTVEDSTCAPTTLEALSTSNHNETSSSINPETKTEASMQSIPDTQFTLYRRAFLPNWPSPHVHYDHHNPHDDSHEPHANFYRPRRFYRRNFPDYYYFQNYFDFPHMNNKERPPLPGFRRFQYDEIERTSASPVTDKTTSTTASPLTSSTKSMFKPTRGRWEENSNLHPKRTKLVATATTESRRTLSQKFKPKLKQYRRQFRVKPKTKGLPSSAKSNLETTKKTTTETKLFQRTKEQKMTTEGKVTTEDQITKDPLMDEIASEFLRELNGTKIPEKQKDKVTNGVTTETKTIRTTLKIHLAGSTRYNIPFPENHAFCFTNPESILCRAP